MSRTLSKVLIICALVVVLPLMIAGTAFAAYYSINATVSIEIYVDQLVNGGRAEVSYKDQTGRIDKKLEVTDGHLKKVTFKTSAVGYDFVGWYAGTYKALAEEIEGGKDISEITYAVKTKDAKVEMTDYQNLVAVFAAKHFTVGYKYVDSPENGVEVTTAPSSNERLLVDGKEDTVGKTDFVYGEKLHNIELKVTEDFPDADKYTFDGWYLEGSQTKYTTATFTDANNIVLTGKWVDSKHISLTYLDDQGNVLTKNAAGEDLRTDFYAGHTYELEDPMGFNFSEGFIEDGYAYSWKDVETGDALTELNSDKDVVVRVAKSAVVYRAKLVYDNAELQLKDTVSKELTFSVDNKNTLDVWKDASNWTATYAFWHFDKLTYSGADVADFATIIDQVIAANPHASTEITINAVKKADVSEVSIDKLIYSSETDDFVYAGPVYKELERLYDEKVNYTTFGTTLYEVFGLLGTDGQLASFYKSEERQDAVTLDSIEIKISSEAGTSSKARKIEATTTLNDLIEFIYEWKGEEASNLVNEGTLTFELRVCFK